MADKGKEMSENYKKLLEKYPELAELDLEDDEDLDEDDILMELAFIQSQKNSHKCKYDETVKRLSEEKGENSAN
ncbi:MAG: hypothetical protein ACTSU2_09845 [Promethearchaeota archaeon]